MKFTLGKYFHFLHSKLLTHVISNCSNKATDKEISQLHDSLFDYFHLKYDIEDLYRKWGGNNDEYDYCLTTTTNSILFFTFLSLCNLFIDLPSSKFYSKALNKSFRETSPSLPGLRLLRQEPVECLFSFICSQNNNIPRIKQLIEKLCKKYGDLLFQYNNIDYYSFPSLISLQKATETELNELGFGYRSKYIVKSVSQVYSKLQSSFSKTINFPLLLHIKRFIIFEKLDYHLQYNTL
jgi:hypothetical protein